MRDTNAVFKAFMISVHVGMFTRSKLTETAEALELRSVNDSLHNGTEFDRGVNFVVGAIGIGGERAEEERRALDSHRIALNVYVVSIA